MFCVNCGKELPDGSSFCPTCGAAQQEATPSPVSGTERYTAPASQSAVQKAKYNTMCIVGLVISCISLLLNFWGLVGIAGTVVSVIGLVSSKERHEQGNTLAIFGIVIGALSIIYALVVLTAAM